MWKLTVPPRIHVFLWLVADNRLLTKDNLAKRKKLDDLSYLFCNEKESIIHLFFDCCVAKLVWGEISTTTNFNVGTDFESVAKWWISSTKHAALNVFCAATLWAIWNLRNEICLQGVAWRDVRMLLIRIVKTLQGWRPVCREKDWLCLEEWSTSLEAMATQPMVLGWEVS
jgi:hypothetical protein